MTAVELRDPLRFGNYNDYTKTVGLYIGQVYFVLGGKIHIKLYEYLGKLREDHMNFH